METKMSGFSALGFPYPLYVVDVLDRNSLVVAGGGGSVKTGVPNRIDIINLYRNGQDARTPVDVQKSGGLDTGTEAVMSLTVVNPGDGGFIASLEGQKCVEYIVQSKVNLVASPAKLLNVEKPASTTDVLEETNLRHRSRRRCTDDKDSGLNKMSTSMQDSDKKDKNNSLNEPVPLEWELTKVREYTLMEQISSSADDSGSESPSGSAPKSLSGMPTCVTHGGPAGTWLAIGSDSGSVFLINRHIQQRFLDEKQLGDSPYQSLIVYPDVSGGLSTGVCSMTFSHGSTCKQDDSTSYPLLATICDRPDWSTLRVWCTNINLYPKSFLFLNDIKSIRSTLNSHQQLIKLKTNTSKRNSSNERGIRMKTFISNSDNNDNSFKIQDDILFSQSMEKYPYAIASCSSLSFHGATPPPSPNLVSTSNKVTSERSSDRSNYRFRHCQFMKYSLKSPISSNQSLSSSEGLKTSESYTVESMLVTTIQPLCANRRSFSRLVVWSVPHPSEAATNESLSSNNIKMHQPIQLKTFAEITLPQGHLPACLAVHPSRSRGLIGVGTMEGRVDVYFLSPSTHCLINIYTLNNAHPIFVTALTFLREDSYVLGRTCQKPISYLPLKSDSFDLVSVSVDRLVKWHHGPTYSTIGKLSHGIININNNVSLLKRIIHPKTCIYVLCLFSILFLPILMVILESVLSNF
ncbi:unnamed protein product [Schistosoma rodhaini]|nr:unnamed protein product [Schistosoma rodhaini]CAH8681206.1 unnamed protein product [Schistosoma rodhaini]